MLSHMIRRLSKSRILSYRQCPKRLWLEVHRPECRDDSASQRAFSIGQQVGEIARKVYDPLGSGHVIDVEALGHEAALEESAVFLANGHGPVMEAGLSAEGALAYVDVMLPDRSNGQLRWRMVEVKSAASVKSHYLDDIAVQGFIAAHSGTPLSSISIAHIDTRFVYRGDGNYQGLFREVDVTEQTRSRFAQVREWIIGAQQVMALTEEPAIATGPQCANPFPCPFRHHCHVAKESPAYPLDHLPYFRHTRRSELNAQGIHDLREVPDRYLNDLQRRVKQCSIEESTFFDADGAAADLAVYGFPAHFLDFEAVQPPIPLWKDTSPYQACPFQYSLHVIDADSKIEHHAFLDLSGNDPRKCLVESLVAHCGTQGPIFAYNATYEASTIAQFAKQFPEHGVALRGIIARLVDLQPIANKRFYHPMQQGSWGLKSVLPALCPDLSYNRLEGVSDGRAAGDAYLEAIASTTTPERRAQLHEQLHAYCHLDTWAMVRMWQIFRGGETDLTSVHKIC